MPIESFGLLNVGPFRPRPQRRPGGRQNRRASVKFEFDDKVNLLIGPNNVGKSTVLWSLACVTGDWFLDRVLPPNRITSEDQDGDSKAVFVLNWKDQLDKHWRLRGHLWTHDWDLRITEIGVGPEKVVDDTADEIEIMYEKISRDNGFIGFYGPESYIPAESSGWDDFLYGFRVDKSDFDVSQYDDSDDIYANFLILLRNSPQRFYREVFSEVMDVIHEITGGFRVDIAGGVGPRKGIITPDGEIPFVNLSQGTRSVIASMVHFILHFASVNYGEPDWRDHPGVFIIDEIDAHLHPSWQRRIIPTLQRHFPNVQIFASTHSPMMVAGLKKGQVHLLKRDETGQVVWSRNERDIIGWTADEIYRKYMEIDDPTDERTARHAEELRDLRNKDNLTPEDEARMQELRRLVNEDLLARGALNAQDERFDEMMRRFMANRQSDLSQDGA